jgi:hypothetical protein
VVLLNAHLTEKKEHDEAATTVIAVRITGAFMVLGSIKLAYNLGNPKTRAYFLGNIDHPTSEAGSKKPQSDK